MLSVLCAKAPGLTTPKDLEEIESVCDDIAELGKNTVNQIKTDISNYKQREREALAKEIVKAEKEERELEKQQKTE